MKSSHELSVRVRHLAMQILHGEFTGASALLTSQLYRDLSSMKTPLTRRAAERLRRDFRAANPPTINAPPNER